MWSYLVRLLELLSVNGMSDEEGTVVSLPTGQTARAYNILLCRWRAPVVTEYMMQIDKATKERENQRGNRAQPRVRTVVESARDAPTGLPRALYNQEWLSEHEDWWVEEVLRVSPIAFELLLAAAGSDSDASL